jgi:tetratricopeptide (TPR) repeat protein
MQRGWEASPVPYKPPTLQDLIKRRQSGGFVGRSAELTRFEQNLPLPVSDPRRQFLFSLHGNAGVGKTLLVQQYVRIAREHGYVTASVDESSYGILATIERFGKELYEQGYPCKNLNARLITYRRRRHELEIDPNAPHGLVQFLTHTAVHLGLNLSETVPIAGAIAKELDRDQAVADADRLRLYVSRRFRKPEESRLMLTPVDVLTESFLLDLAQISQLRPILMLIDTYERSASFLEQWLLDLLSGRYGSMPANLILVISGQRSLDVNLWSTYQSIQTDIYLDVFSEADARQLLADRKITDDKIVEVLLAVSGRLPVLLAMLAETRPSRPDAIGDPSDSAVDRFLKWEPDEQLRKAAICGSLLRQIDKEMLFAVTESASPDKDFDWLRRQPFISSNKKGYLYHEVVRNAMFRVSRRTSPQDWKHKHASAASAYGRELERLDLTERRRWKDERWLDAAIEQNYHLLCAENADYLTRALEGLVDVVYWNPTEAGRWVQSIQQAGRDTDSATISARASGLAINDASENSGKLAILDFVIDEKTMDDVHRARVFAERGSILGSEGKHEEALADYSRAIKLDRSNTWALEHRADTLGSLGRDEEAITDLTQVIELEPEYDLAMAQRGSTYARVGRYDEAIADFTRAIELDAEYDWAIALRGSIYVRMERYDEAIADFTRAIVLDPEYDWAIAQRGDTYVRMERYDEAIADFTRAIELDPEYKWVIASRGLTHSITGEYSQAVRDVTTAIELDAEYDWAIALRGSIYVRMERYDEAVADFTRAIELDAEYDWAIALRGDTYVRMGRYDEAVADFTRAIVLDPEYDWAIAQRGDTYVRMERYDEAVADFTRAIELDPEYDWAIALRGDTYVRMGRYDEAVADYRRVIELDPADGWAFYQLGRYLAERGKKREGRRNIALALETDRQAVSANQRDYRRSFNLVVYLAVLGDFAEAERQMHATLALLPHFASVSEAVTDLAHLQSDLKIGVEHMIKHLRAYLNSDRSA